MKNPAKTSDGIPAQSPNSELTDSQERTANQRFALVITLDGVAPGDYDGWPGELSAGPSDRALMTKLFDQAGFDVVDLPNELATRESVQSAFDTMCRHATNGDLVVVYFSGHGATLPNLNGDSERSRCDQTWCLYDGMLVDDEIAESLAKFDEGVHIVVVSDSCFSGSIVFAALLEQQRETGHVRDSTRRSKLAPVNVGERVYTRQPRYKEILSRPAVDLDAANASVLQLGACADGELAFYDDDGSAFTKALVKVWNDGRFNDTYAKLMGDISAEVSTMEPGQHPTMKLAGAQTQRTLDKHFAFRR